MGSLVTLLTRVLGIVLVAVGVLGFLMPSPLLGIFEVDTMHNIIHVASGAIALVVAGTYAMSRMYLIIFGVVYGIVAIAGFVQGDTVLGLIGVNMADNLLHTGIAAACLIVGMGSKA